MKKLLTAVLTFLCLLLFAVSCRKVTSIEGVSFQDWKPDVALPLVNAKVTIGDLLDNFGGNTYLEEDNLQRLTFVYEGSGFGIASEEITQLIPNFSFPMVDTFFGLPYNLPNNTYVNFVSIKRGYISTLTKNYHAEPLEFILTIPEITLNNQPFEKSIILNPGVIPTISTHDVKGYTLSPTEDSLNFYYSARLIASDSFVTLYDFDPLVALDSMQYDYAEGFLGTGSIPLPRDTVPIDFFDYFSGGEVFFEEPSITITINNSFGFPFRARFNVLQAEKEDGTILPIGNTALNSAFNIDYPSFSEVGQTKQTSFVVDQTNSDISNIIGQPIKFFDYEIEPLANPDNDTTAVGFLTDSSSVYLDFLVELPLYGRATNFTVQDTFALKFSEYEELRHASLRVTTENGFPVDVFMQLYFLNANNVAIDSITNDFSGNNVLAAAPVDADGRSIEINKKTTDFEIPEDRFTRLKAEAEYLMLKTAFTTLDGGQESVRFYSDYELSVKLGILAGLNPQ